MTTWPSLQLSAATAVAPDRFCFAQFDGDEEAPFGIVLSYDRRFPQPWTRTDMPRRIVGIEAVSEDEHGTVYVALSDEGDVYTIDGAGVSTEKISGAGLYSDDAVGYGQLRGLTRQGDTLWAFGLGGQVYRRADGWRRMAVDSAEVDPTTINAAKFDLSGAGWFCGSVAPPLLAKDYKPDLDLERQLDEARAANDLDRYMDLMDQLELLMRGGGDIGPSFLLMHYKSGRFGRPIVDGAAAGILNAVHIESPNRIWLVGTEGAILSGNADSGFQPVTYAERTTENLIDMTSFRDRFVIASDYGLFDFDGHILTRIKPQLPSPEINRNVPTPFSVQGVDGALMYFDYKHGVCRWDGETWDWIDIPQELLVRDFKGLGDTR